MFFQRFERANLLNIWKILFKFDAKSYYNMDNIIENGEWWTAPAESEDGRLVMVTGRKDVAKFRENPRFSIRVEVSWPYEGRNGMPDVETSELMDEVQARLTREFHKDPVAVLTGIYTGGRRAQLDLLHAQHPYFRTQAQRGSCRHACSPSQDLL